MIHRHQIPVFKDSSNGLFEYLTEDALRTALGDRIQKAAKSWGENWSQLERFCSARVLNGIIQQLKGILESSNFFSTTPCYFIHCLNGVLEIEPNGNVDFKPFSPNYRSRHRSPYQYDPDAHCPQFKERLLSHLEHDDRELLQKIAGQSIIGQNLSQRIFILDGPGGASKGAFVKVTRGIVGVRNCGELRTKLLEERFEIGRLRKKSLVLGADVAANFLSTPAAYVLKSLVGGDLKDFEIKNSNDTDGGDGIFNVVITSNTRLQLRLENLNDRSAWERRLTIVRYDQPYKGNKIPEIHEMLLSSEGPGILNWFIEGAQKLFQDIAIHGDIQLTSNQKKRVQDLLDESDSLTLFLKHSIQTSAGDDLTTDEIVQAYAKYCTSHDWTMVPASAAEKRLPDKMNMLFGVLKRHDIQRDSKAKNGYRGVTFRADNDRE